MERTTRLGLIASLCTAVLLVGRVFAQTPAMPPPVAWWPGEGTAADAMGLHDGTLVGGVTFAPGVVGSAFRFDGNGVHGHADRDEHMGRRSGRVGRGGAGLDDDSGIAPALQIQSDTLGAYTNSKTLTSPIQSKTSRSSCNCASIRRRSLFLIT